MKKLLLSLAIVGLLVFALSWTASAADPVVPTVSAIEPASAANDIDARVTITGGDFVAGADGTATVSLGSTALTDVTRVDSATLAATVPWGMDPGVYALTVVNPGGGSATLPGAFSVTQGIGQWNSGKLFGAGVRQLLMKPGDPDTLYALAYDVGVFRSRDAGEHWTFTSANVVGNADIVLDPSHPTWLYSHMWGGLYRSQNEGDSWTKVLDTSQDATPRTAEVFVSPHDPNVLFFGSYQVGVPDTTSARGLLKSVNGAASWTTVHDMDGLRVQDVAFHPTDPLQMALATSDARVFRSLDGGGTWGEVAKPPVSGLGLYGSITYNPYRTGEVWVASDANPGGIYKSDEPTPTTWSDVSPAVGRGSSVLAFTGADSVYVPGHRSVTGGSAWLPFGPSPWYGGGAVVFSPANPLIAYIGDDTVGVQRTTDGGLTWATKNQGLTGMRCVSMSVSQADPLRVYAAFNGWPGVYRSDNGTTDWTYLPIDGSGNVHRVCEDPFDPERLFAAADSGFCVSTDKGESWDDLGWNLSPALPFGGAVLGTTPDPHHPGHLLSGVNAAGNGALYSSTDYGASWQQTAMPPGVAEIRSIAFDPETTGTVYATTMGTGVYKSINDGATWDRIDDLAQQGMRGVTTISIATHPRRMVVVLAGGGLYRSLNGGSTWEHADGPGMDAGLAVNAYSFVEADSTRLYAATWGGLYVSGNAGDSWTRAAGTLGRVQVTAIGYADADGHTILYAATTGGDPGPTGGVAAAASTLVDAGVYRYAQVVRPTSITIKSAATSTYIGRTVRLDGRVTPEAMIGKNIVVYVMKPGKSYWTYSSNRTSYTYSGSPASWMYPYYFKRGMARGYYRFKARCPAPGFASSVGFATSESKTITVRVR